MFSTVREQLRSTLAELDAVGWGGPELVITTPQQPLIGTDGTQLLNLCANNYLGLANHPQVVAAASDALQRWGFGVAAGRGLCGTQEVHKQLEARLSEFLGTEDTILYGSCFDANTGLFETLLDEQDAVVSDTLNHASIIDGIRLCKARRYRYANRDLDDLHNQLAQARGDGARRVLIATDGVFSMDGTTAPLSGICDLAERYEAMVMVDDSHATGIVGTTGRGTAELHGVTGRVDILTGTLGKALGGATGGYIAARTEIVDLLRRRSRPYLFSNSLAPVIPAACLAVLDVLDHSGEQLRARLRDNTTWFRHTMTNLGFDVIPGGHPIVPIMFGDTARATSFAEALRHEGVYVVAFTHPVVPRGQDRIRTQISAAHAPADLENATQAFAAVRDRLS